MKSVYILVGSSGSGKSTYCRNNNLNVVSADNYFYKTGEYKFDRSMLSEAHAECLRTFISKCQVSELDIAVDNTNTSLAEVTPYYSIARAYGYEVTFVFMKCPEEVCAERNIHGVPAKSIKDMHYRLSRLNLPAYWKFSKIEVDSNSKV